MILIQNGRILDPATGTDMVGDLLIEDGKISKVGKEIEEQSARVVDAKGCYVMPGLIDLHVHLRDPGQEYKEDIRSGSSAAARGGFTTIVAMPNTKPVIDRADRVDYVRNKSEQIAPIHVLQAGAITKGQEGEELADIEGMIAAGAPALSEDGKSVMNAQLYKQAMLIAAKHDIPVLAHCEDKSLTNGGCMNEDERSEELGLPGICNASEDVIAARDIILANDTGVKLHLCHCSTKATVVMMKKAKEEGFRVTAEVCPHHFTLSSEDIPGDDPNYKMAPPLRRREDVEALRQGLKEDIMDVISTDHAPHSQADKTGSMRTAAFGIVGLETSVALTITELVKTGILTPMQMAEKMSYNPAKVLGIDRGTLREGAAADVVVIDPDAQYTINKNKFASKGRNTPFHGRKVYGEVQMTICDGENVNEKRQNI